MSGLLDSISSVAAEQPEPQPWPLQDTLDQLKQVDPEELRGYERLGAPLEFADAPAKLAHIIQDLEDLRSEDW